MDPLLEYCLVGVEAVFWPQMRNHTQVWVMVQNWAQEQMPNFFILFAYQPGRFGTGYVNEIFSSEKQLHLNCRIEPLLRMYNSPMNNKIMY